MCVTCGCGNTTESKLSLHEHVHADGTRHSHSHGHEDAVPAVGTYARVDSEPGKGVHAFVRLPDGIHRHDQPPARGTAVAGRDGHAMNLEEQILGKNQRIAHRNRSWFAERAILALNLVSSPGAGKTTLLERTLRDLKGDIGISVVEGDQATSNDAERIRATGVRAVQVNTGTGCHLEADMLERALVLLAPDPASLLLIENVGNLVCPALFDLGERAKVVMFSVTEGEDKPLKYPHMFAAASVLILSKIDLLPHVRFDAKRAIDNAHSINPGLQIFEVSNYTGAGLVSWYAWLTRELKACASTPLPRTMPLANVAEQR